MIPRHLERRIWLALAWALIGVRAVHAAANDWAEGTPGESNGATRDYYNRAGLLKWKHFMGDWRDADNVAQGKRPYASKAVVDNDTQRFILWDVTPLARQWVQGRYQNQGMFLRSVDGGGPVLFRSREHDNKAQRPQLVIQTAQAKISLTPQADTYLERSTYRGQGDKSELRVSGSPHHALLRFDLSGIRQGTRIRDATLRLYTFKQYGTTEVGVFRCSQGHDLPPSQPVLGLAARYPGDVRIGSDAEVVFATDFESPNWQEEWTYAGDLKVIDTTSADEPRKFAPLSGKALRVKIAKGSTGALNTLLKFKPKTGREPEDIYFRYYLRLADDWKQTLQGGKMPGISGTYGVAGWGGRKSNGINGWSARGSFHLSIPKDNPLGGLHPIGTYCYHADMQGTYGDVWLWQNGYRGFLESNRWYAIEQYLKLNTPGQKDGILRAWVDGRLAFEKTDIRFRQVDKLKIEQVWMNVYHGGTKPSPYDQHLYLDNVVIAKKYIGPIPRKQ